MRHGTLVRAGALLAATSWIATTGPARAATGGPQRIDNTWTEQGVSQVSGIGTGWSGGSSYQLHETLHLTADGQGRPMWFDHMSCG